MFSISEIKMRNTFLLLLACAAGAVDVVSYEGLGQVFPANMTGNTVLIGLAFGRFQWQALLFTGMTLLGFLLGVAGGARIIGQRDIDAIWSRRITTTLAIEVVLLIGVLICWQSLGNSFPNVFWQVALIACTAMAMGLQSVAVFDLSIAGVSTTYITGTLIMFISSLVQPQQPRHTDAQSNTTRSQEIKLPLGIWLVYFGGAMIAALLITVIDTLTLLFPIALILLVVVTAFRSYK